MKRRSITSIVLATAILGGGAFAASPYNPWTTWSYDFVVPILGYSPHGLATLVKMRDWLDANALHDTTVAYDKVACPPSSLTARTADGTCNDLDNPQMGATNVRFGRNVPVNSTYPDLPNLMKPNPRLVSIKLLSRGHSPDGTPIVKPVPFLNLLAASWIQFMTHDWFSHNQNELDFPYEVPEVPAVDAGNDPLNIGKGIMLIPRTRILNTSQPGRPPSYRNENTHWFDASQIYGSNQETQDKIRGNKVDGKIQVLNNGRLPIDSDGIEVTGFKRNWWLGLSMLHYLFVSEHNSIAAMLKAKYPVEKFPEWTDEKLFQTARLINAAVIAKIHTVEWTPAILPNDTLSKGMQVNWSGDIGSSSTKIPGNPFSHFLGLVGEKKNLHGVPYTLTEEFVSVYRLHSLLPEALFLQRVGTRDPIVIEPIVDTREDKSHTVTDRYDMKDLFFSFGVQHPGALVLNNFPAFLQNLEILPHLGNFFRFDMGTVDVLRDRERGVPRYNAFRRLINLKPIQNFEQLVFDNHDKNSRNNPVAKANLANLMAVYCDPVGMKLNPPQCDTAQAVERLDLQVGVLAEANRPKDFGFGETMFQIFVVMASRRLQADRFFTTDYTPEVYTPEGLKWVDDATMKDVILRNVPDPKGDIAAAMKNVKTAFNPWQP